MLSTILAVITRIFSNSFANAFQKDLVKDYSSRFVTFIAYLLMSIFCIFPAIFIDWTQFGFEFWLYVIIANFLCTLSTICLVKALQTGELSILSSINSYKCVVGLIVGIFMLHEIPSIWGVSGIILIIYGSRFVFETTKEGFSIAFVKRKDVLLRISAMVLAGIEAVFLKKIIIMSSFDISFILWCFGGLLFAFPIFLFSKHKVKIQSSIKHFHKFLILAICLGLMQLSTNFVFARLNVGLSLALFQLSVIVNLFLGYKIFKETEILKKFIGMVIMIIGSVFILILNH